jgi:hypothetical protein
LFAPVDDEVISSVGTVENVAGTGPWTAEVSGMTSTLGLAIGSVITATDGTGSLGSGGDYIVNSVTSTSITFTATNGTAPVAGDITNLCLLANTGRKVQTNPVLQTWPEGYVYASLREYYIKRHNDADAAVYQQKYADAWNIVEDQNNLGKWSGGHTRLTSVWQPRQYRQYNIK